jgi:hypothetical protein
MSSKLKFTGLILLFLISFAAKAQNADEVADKAFSWLIEIESNEGSVTTLYQPQLESFQSNILEGRMAVTVKPESNDLIFGAVWFKAIVSTDTENRTVLLDKMHIEKTHFPDMVDEEKKSKFSTYLTTEIESRNIQMSLDRLLACLDEVESLNQLSDKINNDPPEIYFRSSPAVLVIIDGEPISKTDEKSGLEFIVNTPYFIVKDPKKNDYYLNGGPFWYNSNEITKGWEEAKKVPSKIKKFAEKQDPENETDSVAQSFTEAPDLIIATKQAELILVDG